VSTPPAPQAEWQRLDPRMLMVYPINEIMKYIPVLLGSIIVGTTSGNPLWSLIPVTLVAGFGVARWFTTSYRIDADHVQLRSGIVQRRTLSVPRPRIRSVDVEAPLLHRALGLAVLAIGTGKQTDKGEEFKLDALDTSRIPALRAELLSHTGQFPTDQPESPGVPHVAPHDAAAESGVEIGHWRAAWVRYAPLSLTGLAVVAPIAGLGAQYGLIDILSESPAVQHLDDDSPPIVAIVITGLTLLSVALVSLAACAQYLATWFGLRVIDNGATLHLRHGLFTTRQITLDLARFRGATLNDPLLLRAAKAAQLEMIMTGENPRQKILPQAPRTAVERTLDELLRTRRKPDGPLDADPAPPDSGAEPSRPTSAAPLHQGGVAGRRAGRRAARRRPELRPAAGLALGPAGGVRRDHGRARRGPLPQPRPSGAARHHRTDLADHPARQPRPQSRLSGGTGHHRLDHPPDLLAAAGRAGDRRRGDGGRQEGLPGGRHPVRPGRRPHRGRHARGAGQPLTGAALPPTPGGTECRPPRTPARGVAFPLEP